MPLQRAEVGCSGIYGWRGWKRWRCVLVSMGCLGFFAAPGISVQQVKTCAVLVTYVPATKARRGGGAGGAL